MNKSLTVASFQCIQFHCNPKPIKIICTQPIVEVDNTPKKCPKYRKVGKATKAILIELVNSGTSIVSAATKLGINYSTAKSIIQAKNKENTSKGTQHCLTDDSNQKITAKQALEIL